MGLGLEGSLEEVRFQLVLSGQEKRRNGQSLGEEKSRNKDGGTGAWLETRRNVMDLGASQVTCQKLLGHSFLQLSFQEWGGTP